MGAGSRARRPEGVVTAVPPEPVGRAVDPDVAIPDSSDRTVALRNDPSGIIARSVLTLAHLPLELPDHALVGGLAVMVRLSESHRVTTDFDEVTADREGAIGVLVAGGAMEVARGVYLPEAGLQLDLLDAGISFDELATTETTSDMEREAVRLAQANRYALESAVLTDVVVLDGEDVAARVPICVATAGALVAMKVNSALSSTRTREKAAADTYDAYRLIRAWGSDVIVDDLAPAPEALRSTAADQIARLYRDDVDRTAYELRRVSVPGVESVDAGRLSAVAVVGERLAGGVVSPPAGAGAG
jgi:hypothetical protein